MMDRLRARWGLSRILRLLVATAFLWTAIAEGEAIAWFAAAFFGIQALFNLGCCVTACATPPVNRSKNSVVEEVHYEEVH